MKAERRACQQQPSRRLTRFLNLKVALTLDTAKQLLLMSAQAIQEAVDNGGGYGYTRHAGRVGSTLAWAAGQDDQVRHWLVNTPALAIHQGTKHTIGICLGDVKPFI